MSKTYIIDGITFAPNDSDSGVQLLIGDVCVGSMDSSEIYAIPTNEKPEADIAITIMGRTMSIKANDGSFADRVRQAVIDVCSGTIAVVFHSHAKTKFQPEKITP